MNFPQIWPSNATCKVFFQAIEGLLDSGGKDLCIHMTLIFFQKLQERTSAFKKRRYQPKDNEKWSKVLVSEFMSSEESGEENDIIVKPLPWRASRVDSFFCSLDEETKNGKLSQSIRQMKSRILGDLSSRPQPSDKNFPSLAIVVE